MYFIAASVQVRVTCHISSSSCSHSAHSNKAIIRNDLDLVGSSTETIVPRCFNRSCNSGRFILETPSKRSISPFSRRIERLTGSWLSILDKYVSIILNSARVNSERQRPNRGFDFCTVRRVSRERPIPMIGVTLFAFAIIYISPTLQSTGYLYQI